MVWKMLVKNPLLGRARGPILRSRLCRGLCPLAGREFLADVHRKMKRLVRFRFIAGEVFDLSGFV